jgi:hypothetical protein
VPSCGPDGPVSDTALFHPRLRVSFYGSLYRCSLGFKPSSTFARRRGRHGEMTLELNRQIDKYYVRMAAAGRSRKPDQLIPGRLLLSPSGILAHATSELGSTARRE